MAKKKPDPYGTLGVSATASEADVKRAFRRRAKESHPDHGGTREEFEAVKSAHLVLSDPEKRKRYDETGDAGDDNREPTVREKATKSIAELLTAIINQDKIGLDTDVIAVMREQVGNEILEMTAKRKTVEAKKNRAERIAKKLKRKTKGENLLTRMAEDRARSMELQIAKINKMVGVLDEMTIILRDYAFDADKPAPMPRPPIPPLTELYDEPKEWRR